MSLELPFGVKAMNPVPLDAWAGPYASTGAAVAAIPAGVRWQGMTVSITSAGVAKDYWFRDGILDANLILKEQGTSVGGLVTVATTTYTLLVENVSKIHHFTNTGARTITLPSAALTAAGLPFWLKDAAGNAATNNITINRAGADTIENGSTSAILNRNGQVLGLYSNGVDKWFAI